jgi:hypothetical protein
MGKILGFPGKRPYFCSGPQTVAVVSCPNDVIGHPSGCTNVDSRLKHAGIIVYAVTE